LRERAWSCWGRSKLCVSEQDRYSGGQPVLQSVAIQRAADERFRAPVGCEGLKEGIIVRVSWVKPGRTFRKDDKGTIVSQIRGILPDAVDDARVVLLKACIYLRLTYEIRTATFMAQKKNRTLVLACKKVCRFSPELESFLTKWASIVQVHRS
jgi:hypothetical protein